MANHKSAKKCIRKIQKQTLVNKSRTSKIKTCVRKFESMLQNPSATNEELRLSLSQAEGALMRGWSQGVLHKNTASRKASRLAKKFKAKMIP